jgi:hypothetical protein
MRRLTILAIAVLTLLVVAAYGYNHVQDRVGRRPEGTTARPTTGREVPKGTVLVQKLPEGTEGVVMEKGVIKARPGYKFEKKDNKVTVMSMIGGGGTGGSRVGGEWSCVCKQGVGGCSTMVQDNQIYCAPGGEPACPDKCVLSVIIKANKAEIIRY